VSAATWVLLRGLTREHGHWGAFTATFARALPHAQVIALDLPGCGEWHRERSPARVEAMAEHCRAQLQRRGVVPPYHVLAMSLGAMVAMAWAERHPHELAAAVLINTSLRPFNPFWQRLKPGRYGTLLRFALMPMNARDRERVVLRITSRASDHGSALLDAWLAIRRERPVSAANALRQLWAAARYRAPLTKPQVPLLLLASRGDALVDPRCSLAIAQRWACEIAMHPWAGHDLPLDDADWVVQQVRERTA
jgi:pimeloyl-ACP methyl ester carboxylesterase